MTITSIPSSIIDNLYGKSSPDIPSVDSVVNRTLIPKLTNIQIGKKSPSSYLQQLQRSNSNLAVSLESHLIPYSDELMKGDMDKKFEKFAESRANKIFAFIDAEVIERYKALRAKFQT